MPPASAESGLSGKIPHQHYLDADYLDADYLDADRYYADIHDVETVSVSP